MQLCRIGLSEHKLKHWRLRTHLFIVSMTEPWHRLPQGCGVSILGDAQKLSEHGPGQLILGGHA